MGVSAFWRGRATLVTGATGLVGGWVVEQLVDRGADVVALVRDRVPWSRLLRSGLADRVTIVRGDVRDHDLIERALGEYETDTVLHLAAQTIVTIANRNPLSTFESNVGGTWAVLEACRRSPLVRQIVVASSDKAYGAHERLPYDEDASLAGSHPYDVSKSCADLIARAYAATYDLPVVVTRCGNLFGGGDLNWNRLVPGTIRSILHGERPIVRSDGSPVRDYLYVEDGAEAFLLLAEALASRSELKGHAFNFSNELRLTALDVVARIAKRMASPLEVDVRNESTNEILEQYLSSAKARQMLGWQPRIGFEEGLERTIGWYRDFFRS